MEYPRARFSVVVSRYRGADNASDKGAANHQYKHYRNNEPAKRAFAQAGVLVVGYKVRNERCGSFRRIGIMYQTEPFEHIWQQSEKQVSDGHQCKRYYHRFPVTYFVGICSRKYWQEIHHCRKTTRDEACLDIVET